MTSKADEIQDMIDALQIADRCWQEEHVTVLAANAQVCIAKILNEIQKSMQEPELQFARNPVRKYTLSPRFKLMDELIEGLPKDAPSKNFLKEFRRKYMEKEVFSIEQRLVDNLNAIERLQEFRDMGRGRLAISIYRGKSLDGYWESVPLQGSDLLSEIILNITVIEEGESSES